MSRHMGGKCPIWGFRRDCGRIPRDHGYGPPRRGATVQSCVCQEALRREVSQSMCEGAAATLDMTSCLAGRGYQPTAAPSLRWSEPARYTRRVLAAGGAAEFDFSGCSITD